MEDYPGWVRLRLESDRIGDEPVGVRFVTLPPILYEDDYE